MDKYQLIPDLNELLAEAPADSIVSRSVRKQPGLSVSLFAFAPGQELSEHTASRPAILHFVAGEATLTLGEDKHEVGPGAWVQMPAGLTHAIYARTAVTMLLYLSGA